GKRLNELADHVWRKLRGGIREHENVAASLRYCQVLCGRLASARRKHRELHAAGSKAFNDIVGLVRRTVRGDDDLATFGGIVQRHYHLQLSRDVPLLVVGGD